MPEIPEHLLKRSRERRAALGLGDEEAASGESSATEEASSPAATTPAPTTPAAPPAESPPTETEPEPPQPVPAYIEAAQQRRRLPWWSIPVFAALPLWAWIFLRTLSPVEVEADPLAGGQALYASQCAACHGGAGEGASAPSFADGAVLETFPDFRDHMMWVRVGAGDWPSGTYGANDSTPRAMPGFAALTDQELAQVVLHERQALAGAELTEEEIGTGPDGQPIAEEDLLLIAEGELTFADVGVGPLSADAGFTEANLEGP